MNNKIVIAIIQHGIRNDVFGNFQGGGGCMVDENFQALKNNEKMVFHTINMSNLPHVSQ